MASSDSELTKISAELNHLSLKRRQLLERKKMQCIFQELRNRVEFGQTEEAALNHHESHNIDDELKQLTERTTDLQKRYDNILNVKEETNMETETKVSFSSCQKIVPVPASDIFYVEAPSFPAPTVILDAENFPACPCRTRCPECQQFIVTETYSSVSSLTWLVCCMTALIGGVAGCCLIPFCLDKFKSITHRCPRCRTSIWTIKKL